MYCEVCPHPFLEGMAGFAYEGDCCTKVNLSLCNSPSFRIGAGLRNNGNENLHPYEIGHTNKDDCNARPYSCALIDLFPTSSYAASLNDTRCRSNVPPCIF